jgi:phage shock protein PspC (stress-responsive transcriptional regulator)
MLLIVLGVWLLLGKLPFWGTIRLFVDRVFDFAWPVGLIALGVFLLFGAKRSGVPGATAGKRLYRSRTDRMVGGVIGGLAAYLGMDSTWLRLVAAVIGVLSGGGLLVILYLIAMIAVPEEPVGQTEPQQPLWPSQPEGTETVQPPIPPAPPVPPVPPAPPQG